MRVAVTGGRDFTDRAFIHRVLDAFHAKKPISVLIHGDARGADKLSASWAKAVGVEVLVFPADWERYRNRAGPVRNRQMLREGLPDIVIAFPGGSGTKDMVSAAGAANVKVLDTTSLFTRLTSAV